MGLCLIFDGGCIGGTHGEVVSIASKACNLGNNNFGGGACIVAGVRVLLLVVEMDKWCVGVAEVLVVDSADVGELYVGCHCEKSRVSGEVRRPRL